MSTPTARRPSPLALVLIAPIRFYQRFITPYTPATCRFYPTCSSYAVTALREYGALRGTWLTLRRLGRCHPWSEGGIDYVPPRRRRGGEPESPRVSSDSESSVSSMSSAVPASAAPKATGTDVPPAQTTDSRPAAPTDRSAAA